MTDSNRTRIAYVKEATQGTTPAITSAAPMKTARITGESLNFDVQATQSNELRSDRQVADLIQVGASAGGGLDWELSYPEDNTFLDDMLGSVLQNPWVEVAVAYNQFVADDQITDAGTTANTYAVLSPLGTPFVVGHLARASGFTNGANNQRFRVVSSTATTVVGAALGLVAEAVPPIGARLKAIGFQGASGDLTLTTGPNRINSTTLALNTLGIVPGMWLKIGGPTAGEQFATTADNDFVRCSGTPTATTIPIDNVPTGYAADTGAGKTITIYFGDYIKNGITPTFFTFEKGFLALAVPEYFRYRGMQAGGATINVNAQEIITGNFSFLGMGHDTSLAQLGVPAAATTREVMNSSANVGRIAEAGATIVGPNFIRSLVLNITNNLRPKPAVGSLALVGVGSGQFGMTGRLQTYLGSSAIYAKLISQAATSINARVTKLPSGQTLFNTVVLSLPNLKIASARVVATGPNTDVLADMNITAILDTTTNCMFQIDRFEEHA